MHLGIVCNEYPPAPHGGIGSSNQDLAEGMVALGHKVTVVGIYPASAKNPPGEIFEEVKGVRIIRRYFRFDKNLFRLRQFIARWLIRRTLLREHARARLDLIEFADYGGWLPWGGPKGVPVVARLQGTNALFDRFLGRSGDATEYEWEKRSLLKADFWLGISQFSFSETLRLCNLSEHKGGNIYHAVDTELFSPGNVEQVESGKIVFVNTLNPKKGIEQLIGAVNLLFGKYPYARLVVIGMNGARGDGKRTYTELLAEKVKPEFRERVTFTGALDRRTGVLGHLRSAQIGCYPSHIETFGIAPVEAMSVGKATIFSTAGPGPEVIEDGVSGLLCDPKDANDVAAKIETLLTNPDLCAKLGKNARDRVLAMFDKRNWVQKNIDFFEKCLVQSRSGE